jgi:hypothetical protein
MSSSSNCIPGFAIALLNFLLRLLYRAIILGCTCSQIVVEYGFDDDFIEEEIQKKRRAADIPTNEIKGEFQVIYTGTCPFIAS